MLALAETVRRTATANPDAPAIRVGETTWSYATLRAAVERFADTLRADGLVAGDRVAILLPNVAEFVVCYYAVLLAGGVAVPLNPLTRSQALASYLDDCQPTMALAAPDTLDRLDDELQQAGTRQRTVGPDLLAGETATAGGGGETATAGEPGRPAVEHDGSQTAALLYTPGATETLGVELTHDNLAWAASAAASVFGLQPGQTLLCGFPLFHVFGQTCGLNAALTTGACLSLLAGFDPVDAIRTIEQHEVTVLSAFPTVLERVSRARPGDGQARSLRAVYSTGGAGLPARARSKLAGQLGCEVLQGYGRAETSGLGCATPPGSAAKPDSVGPPVDGVQVRVADHRSAEMPDRKLGEVLVRGPNVMKGYWQHPEATDKAFRDGWLVTTDGARRDEDGEHYIVETMGWADLIPGRRAGRPGLAAGLKRWLSRGGG